jgi:hypothetical protein
MTASDSTEYMIHLLRTSLDDVRERMRLESNRDKAGIHYHLVVAYSCIRPGCAGVDPVIYTYSLLLAELGDMEAEFPGHILSARHIP